MNAVGVWTVAATAVAAWVGAYWLCRLLTRPMWIGAGPATQDFPGPEPPAVVSLLANRWRITVDAAESTLLDLAARGFFEIRQPAADPHQTTIHLRSDADEHGLADYERRVLRRVRGAAVGGVVPLPALTFRNSGEAAGWSKRLTAEVVADARRRGFSRRRFGRVEIAVLTGLGVLPSTAIGFALAYAVAHSDDPEPGGQVVALLLGTVISACTFGGVAARYAGERDTAAGREAAARWLGLRGWLAGHEAFADLPPASVAVWDRYLGYGAALGVTRTASAVIDLGMGSRELVWSSYGGPNVAGPTWHRVRVRYPGKGRRYGRPTRDLIVGALMQIGFGVLLIRFWQVPQAVADLVGEIVGRDLTDWRQPIEEIGRVLGIVLVLLGAYKLIRTLVDVATTREITGEVLWLDVWRTHSGGEDKPAVPWLHHLAVDDGKRDRTTAWALPTALADRCDPGDVVRIKVRPWTRRVVELAVVRNGTGYGLAGHHTSENTEHLVDAALGGGPAGPHAGLPPAIEAPAPTELLTVEEVGQAVGQAVTAQESPVNVGVRSGFYVTADRSSTVLLVQVASGMMADLAWRSWQGRSRATALPGIADGAFARDGTAAARVGRSLVTLTLLRDGRAATPYLPWLLTRASQRLQASPTAAAPPL